jgi:hypothetical protein
MAAVSSLIMIQGTLTMSAGLMAELIKVSGKYRYKITKITNDECVLNVFEKWDTEWVHIGDSSFSMEDAKAANLCGKAVWKQYPRNMLFARAISNMARWYCRDVFRGAVYTPEEMESVNGEASSRIEPTSPKDTDYQIVELPTFRGKTPAELQVWVMETLNMDSDEAADFIAGVKPDASGKIAKNVEKAVQAQFTT